MRLIPKDPEIESVEKTSPSLNDVKRAKIALFGIFGIQNLGNECTLQAMIANVRNHLPDAELYSICYAPDDTSQRHNLVAVPVSAQYLRKGTAARPAHRHRLVTVVWRLLRRPVDEFVDWFRAFRVLRGTTLVAMTGTGLLTDYSTSCFGFPYNIFKWTVAARLAGCRVRFVGIGVGPIYEKLSRVFIKSALGLSDYRSFRDRLSRTRIEQLGFPAHTDPIVPDLAFSLPHGALPHCSSNARPKHIVGLGVMNYVDAHAAGHVDQKARYAIYIDKMCDFSAWLLQHGYGLRILQGDLKYDGTVRHDLRCALERRGIQYEDAGILDEDVASVEDLLRQIAQIDVVVSPRFHNLILGLMLNKPVISISYDPKHDALLDGFGLAGYCQAIDRLDVDQLIAQLLDLESRVEELKPLIRERTEEYRTRLAMQYRVLLDDL